MLKFFYNPDVSTPPEAVRRDPTSPPSSLPLKPRMSPRLKFPKASSKGAELTKQRLDSSRDILTINIAVRVS